MKILIVDDKADARLILKKTLEFDGHQVEEASDGSEALEKARKRKPDMIVSDILMPVMDGYVLCREVRQDEALCEVPFVFYTATYTDDKDEKLALELGADRFIRKPLDGPQFLAAIKGVVREAAQGRLAPSEPVMENEEAFLKEYNERLIQKLEKKMEDLERETTVRRQSEQILKGTLAAIPDMIFRLDREGRFLDFKPAKTFDPYLTPEQFLGKTAVEVHSQELARKTMESIARALDENTTVALEYQLPYGEELRSYEARHAPCGEDLVVVVVRDITEQKQMEEELLRAQKLESVGVLAGGMGGKDAVKKLLEIDPEVKAIVSSGYSDDLVLSNFQEYGFKGVIPKPFESLSLGKVLYEVLQGEKE